MMKWKLKTGINNAYESITKNKMEEYV